MLSHDWPRGITRYGNEAQLIRFKKHFEDEIQTNTLGSPPGMEILEKLLPAYWFAGHLHCKFAAVFEQKTKFLCILKSTNHLQRAMPTDKHMPGPGYSADRWD